MLLVKNDSFSRANPPKSLGFTRNESPQEMKMTCFLQALEEIGTVRFMHPNHLSMGISHLGLTKLPQSTLKIFPYSLN